MTEFCKTNKKKINISLFLHLFFRNLMRLSVWKAERLEKIYKNQENYVYFIDKNWNKSFKIQKKTITFQLWIKK